MPLIITLSFSSECSVHTSLDIFILAEASPKTGTNLAKVGDPGKIGERSWTSKRETRKERETNFILPQFHIARLILISTEF